MTSDAQSVTRADHGGTAILTVSAPDGNALAPGVRAALIEALAAAAADDAVTSVVLRGAGRSFSSDTGLVVAETLEEAPTLATLCQTVEDARKPVVAALVGTVAGPGLELALAAHARVAHGGVRLILPGVAYGLPPAGGTVARVARLAGAEVALSLVLDGQVKDAAQALAANLVSEVAEGPPTEAALSLAAALAKQGTFVATRARTDGVADPAAFMAAVARRADKVGGSGNPAPAAILRAIESVVMLPFEIGLEMERAAFSDCLETEAAAALLHAARIEQRALAPGAVAQPIERIAVLGAEHGTSLAAQAVAQGYIVDLIDLDATLLDNRRRVIATVLDGDPGADLSRLSVATALDRCKLADLVMVAEPGEIGAEYLRLAGLEARSGAVIAAFDADVAPNGLTARGLDTVAVYWPKQDASRTHAAVSSAGGPAVATVAEVARRFGRHPVRTAWPPERPALALNAALLRVVERLLLQGARPGAIDRALAASGWRGGPCLWLDAKGLDAADADAQRAAEKGWGPAPLGVAATLAEAGLTGAEAAQGLYAYKDGAAARTSGALERAIPSDDGAAPTPDEIVERLTAALAVAGLRLIEEGALPGPAEVDLTALHALGVPRLWGGPMQATDARGLLWLRGVLRDLAEDDLALWAKPAILDRLILEGPHFAGLEVRAAS